MPTFAYQAADGTGQDISGTLEAADRAAAVKQLSAKGLQPFKVTESFAGAKGAAASAKATAKAKAASDAGANPTGPISLSSNQVQIFTEELAELLEAGMRLEPALKLMEGKGDKAAHRRAAKRIGDLVREGHQFSTAVKSASPSFGDLFCSVAAAGEAGGALATSMRRQAIYMANAREMKSKLTVAMIYPLFLLAAAIGVTVLFATYLIPKLTSLISTIRGTLPPAIKFLLALSDFTKQWWWLILAGGALAIMLFIAYAKSKSGRPVWDRLQLRIPIFGRVLSAGFHTQFLETLASLSVGGLPLLRGLELASRVTPNVFIHKRLDQTIDSVRDGASLSRSLEKTDLFPTNLIEMVRIGEHTGDLPGALRRSADRCGRELTKTLEKALALLQPVIIVMMAGLVGVMAYLMISVIFQTMNAIRTR